MQKYGEQVSHSSSSPKSQRTMGGSQERAIKFIDGAADAGVDAVKFQAYTPNELTLDSEMPGFVIHGDNPWTGWRLFDLYAEAATPYEWFPVLYEHVRKRKLIPFTTPFRRFKTEIGEALQTLQNDGAVAVGIFRCNSGLKAGEPLSLETLE